jgi:hypothetical protein
VARARERPSGVILLVLALAMVAAAVLLAYWSRGQWFSSDDLGYAIRIATQPFGHALLHPPPNKYLIAFPLLLYKALFETFGLDTYVPYRITGILLVLLSAGMLFELLRRYLPDRFAIPPMLLMLFFGAGWEVVATPIRIPSQLALAAGLGMMLALERRDRRGDLVAMVLLAVSLASHPIGISFTAVAAVMILLRSWNGWQRLWVAAVPGALFAAWWIFLRAPDLPSFVPNRASDVFPFVRQSWAALTAAVSGLFGVLDQPAYQQVPAQIAAVALLALLAVGIAFSWRRLPPTFWAALVGLVVLMATTRLSPAGFFRHPDESRYLYPEAFFLLIGLGVLAGTLKLPNWAMWVASAVLLISLWPNIDRLHDGGRSFSGFSGQYRVEWSAAEIARPSVQPAFKPDQISADADEYLAAVRAFGPGGYSPDAIANRSEDLRTVADSNLATALGLTLAPAPAPPRGGPSPRVVDPPANLTSGGGCVTVPEAKDQAPLVTEFILPPAGAWLKVGAPTAAAVTLRRFADRPSVRLAPPPAGGAALRTPPDQAGRPWRLVVQAAGEVSVCGLGPGSSL